jgi:zinc/manganese transport system substrate-binding protein
MKNILKISLCVLAFAATGPAVAALKVFACEPEWAALVQELAGDKVSVFSATTAMQDPHHVEARPSLIARLRQADLAVCTGAELEVGWMPMLQRQAGNAKVQPGQPGYVEVADFVERLDIPTVLDRSLGDIHADGNPHVHTDPRRIATIAYKLTERLASIDPDNAAHYHEHHESFRTRWDAAIERWTQQAASLKGTRVVAHHKHWIYLYDWLGIRDAGTLEAKPGLPPSAAHLAVLKTRLTREPARLIIVAAHQNPRAAQWLSDQTTIRVAVLPYTVGGNAQATDLFKLFDDTIARLLEAAR